MLHERVQIERRRLTLSQDPLFDDPHERVTVMMTAGTALLDVGQYAEALSQLLEAERAGAQMQDPDRQFEIIRWQCHCYYQLDRWDQVLKIEEIGQELEKHYRLWGRCWTMALSAGVRARRGEFGQAAALRDESYGRMLDVFDTEAQWERHNCY